MIDSSLEIGFTPREAIFSLDAASKLPSSTLYPLLVVKMNPPTPPSGLVEAKPSNELIGSSGFTFTEWHSSASFLSLHAFTEPDTEFLLQLE